MHLLFDFSSHCFIILNFIEISFVEQLILKDMKIVGKQNPGNR